MSKFNYLVTAHRPSVVTHACVGNFTSPSDLNLILGKLTWLDIRVVGPEGLETVLEAPLNARIVAMQTFRPRNDNRDRLFILTEKFQFCILQYDPRTKELVTKANGSLKLTVGRVIQSLAGAQGLVDPQCRVLGMHFYQGVFQMLPMNPETGDVHSHAYDLRLSGGVPSQTILQVLSMAMLDGCAQPTLAVLYLAPKDTR